MKVKPLLILFSIVFLLMCYATFMNSLQLIRFVSPLVVILLASHLVLETKLKGRYHKRIMTGLICAWIGDLFAIFHPGQIPYSAAALCLGIVFYIRAFALDYKSNPELKIPYFLGIAIGLALICSGFFFYLQPTLGAYQFPVLMYVVIMLFFSIMAINRYGRVNIYSFKLSLASVFLFMCSNGVLAFNHFVLPIPNAATLCVASYMAAQCLMVYAAISRKLVTTETEI